ncbi:MAG: PAS domain S-box protein [Polyangia bacterium]
MGNDDETRGTRESRPELQDGEHSGSISDEQYRLIVEHANEAIVVTRDGLLAMINPSAERLLELPAERLLDRQFIEFIHPEDREMVAERYRRRLAGEPVEEVYAFRVVDARERSRWVEISAVRIEWEGRPATLNFISEITERVRAQAELKRLIRVLEQSFDVMSITDQDGVISWVNPSFERVTGWSREQAIGSSIAGHRAPEEDPAIFEQMNRAVRAGEVWQGRFGCVRCDGTRYRAEVSVSPVCGEGGEIEEYVNVSRDVTSEELLEERIRTAQKMEAVASLAGGVAHEFNNILHAVLARSREAVTRPDTSEETREDLAEIARLSRRASILVKRLMSMEGGGGENAEEVVDVGRVLRGAIDAVGDQLPAELDLRVQAADDLPAVVGSEQLLHEVCYSLLQNALEALASPAGMVVARLGVVEVSDDWARGDPDLDSGSYLRLEVVDTGRGIPPDRLQRIFDPFFSTKEKSPGGGLGLFRVHGIVRGMGGAVRVSSRPGRGSTFEVYLPAAARREADTDPAPAEWESGGEARKVMVVDDEATIARVFARALRRLGYRVEAFTESPKALEAFRGDPDGWDVLLTDQIMPEMNGDRLVRNIRRIAPDLPVVMCTGYSEEFDEEQAASIGISEYLSKPVLVDEIDRAIRRALNGEEGGE